MSEPLLTKRQAAGHFAVSVRTVDTWLACGAPHVRLAGRPKLRATELESWLERSGRLVRRGNALAMPRASRVISAFKRPAARRHPATTRLTHTEG